VLQIVEWVRCGESRNVAIKKAQELPTLAQFFRKLYPVQGISLSFYFDSKYL